MSLRQQYYKDYYENNKTRIGMKYCCGVCNGIYTLPNRSNHFKTEKHTKGVLYEALEEVIIEGWEQGDERVHHPITRLPDTVKTITLYEQLHIVIEHLPSSLETFVYQGYGEDGQDYDEDYDEDYESYAERNY